MLPKQHRFASRTEIRQVFRNATRKHSNSFMWLISRPSERANLPWRAAVIVSKKIAPLATDRNTIRRKISEALWQNKDKIPAGVDVVILTQRKSLSTTLQQLDLEIQAIAN